MLMPQPSKHDQNKNTEKISLFEGNEYLSCSLWHQVWAKAQKVVSSLLTGLGLWHNKPQWLACSQLIKPIWGRRNPKIGLMCFQLEDGGDLIKPLRRSPFNRSTCTKSNYKYQQRHHYKAIETKMTLEDSVTNWQCLWAWLANVRKHCGWIGSDGQLFYHKAQLSWGQFLSF